MRSRLDLPAPGRAGQHQRLAGRDAEIDIVEDGQPHPALIVQGEGSWRRSRRESSWSWAQCLVRMA